MPPVRRPGAPDLALVGAALCFGGTFLVVQDAVERVEPVPFLAVRFTIGALVLWPLARRRPGRPGEWRDGILCGLALLAGYVFQTIGLQYTDSATSAFITYQLVVFVPLLEAVVHRRRPHPATLVGVVLAVVGLVLLTDPGATDGFGRGELLTVGCALAFGVHVLLVAQAAQRHDPVRITAIQVGVVGALCAGPGLAMGGYGFPAPALGAAAATAVVATAGAFFLQVFGQRSVPPTRAALLLLLEPVFAAVLAALSNDPLRAAQLVGAGVILAAILVSELVPTLLDRRVGLRQAGPDNDRS